LEGVARPGRGRPGKRSRLRVAAALLTAPGILVFASSVLAGETSDVTGVLRTEAQAPPAAGAAQTAAPAQPTSAPPEPEPEAPKIDVTAFVDTYYLYNFNKVDPALRSFDVQHNAFSLSLADVAFAKGVTADSRVGFRAELAFGKTADLIAAYEPEDDAEIGKHILQAYGSVLAGSRLQLDFGKFLTPIGAEVVPSQDNWNYSRSVLFGYAIPFYHLGVRASLPLNDELSLGGYLVNGWNNSSEIGGDFPVVGVSATVKPGSKLTWVANYMGGKETEGGDTRHIFDTTLTLNATEKLGFMGNFDYGSEGDTSWWGVAAYARLQVVPSWYLAGRYEYLDDSDGGFMTIGRKAQTLTLTSDHVVKGGLRLRLEYRGDFTDDAYFTDDDGDGQDSQHALLVGLVVAFGGKI
jgi:hypothetical protein